MIETNREQVLRDRLSLIETMIAEGRQTTESWGWTFVLWGAAYTLAIVVANIGTPLAAWSAWGHRPLAWPITMVGAMLLMFLILRAGPRDAQQQPDTTMGRAIFSLWIAMGLAMFLLLVAMGTSGRLDQQDFIAIVGCMLGLAHAASSMILRWKTQFVCALVWWGAAIAACFLSVTQSLLVFLAAIFLGQILFGGYMMLSEARERRQGVVHA